MQQMQGLVHAACSILVLYVSWFAILYLSIRVHTYCADRLLPAGTAMVTVTAIEVILKLKQVAVRNVQLRFAAQWIGNGQ